MIAGVRDHAAICFELLVHRRHRPQSFVLATSLVGDGVMEAGSF